PADRANAPPRRGREGVLHGVTGPVGHAGCVSARQGHAACVSDGGGSRAGRTHLHMASYRGHLAFSSLLGVGYGSVAVWHLGLAWGPACVGAGVTAAGGLLPDLDSDSGVPVRELFTLAATATPFLLFERLRAAAFTNEQTLVLLVATFLLIRYGASR